MRFQTGLAVLCLSAGFGAGAFGQTTTNGPAPPSLTPEAEQRARELLNQTLQSNAPSAQATSPKTTTQDREAARKRVETDARRRFDEKSKAVTAAPVLAPAASAPKPAVDATTDRDREIQRIESEVEK